MSNSKSQCDYVKTVCGSNGKEWRSFGLKDYGDFGECVEFVNQSEFGDGELEGEWYYADEEELTIYYGSFGNYNSPGASHHTYADVHPDEESFRDSLAEWEACPEYLPTDEDEEDEDEAEDEE